ncbi:MAG: hypothetical protein F6J98_27995 [Moorea sp. SIO4G2]|uniref:hypothetical protein n=1 Tax=unclassified Moorena TaxID=2683338 RepID=UPI0013FC3F16|nr:MULTISPECIES: hypothetical protein [unclassified Moorena]NEO15541.1 hypothetical protein [Moorena sp. SIO3E8]NEO64051.1 hypothetical protein [Moorena sp. SIO4G2]
MQRGLGGFPHERLHQEARFIFVQVLIRYKTLYKTVEKLDFRSDLQSEGSEESVMLLMAKPLLLIISIS